MPSSPALPRLTFQLENRWGPRVKQRQRQEGTDLLVTKPSELAYYPIPKLFMKHIGGHEVYGAVHGQEFGDSTFECPTKKEAAKMLDRLISDKEILIHVCHQIDKLKDQGYYDGAYECVRLAIKK